MVVLTEEEQRKRAEHNDGCLSSLEEIAVHQLDIKKIENFDKLTRHIKQILMQNNMVEKMENLNKLKELEYLNLALNQIAVIENIEGCESLKKLDLTCNFIELADYMESLMNLKKVASMREIYWLGNPCSDWKEGHRALCIAVVPQLMSIDGKEITKLERIEAHQKSAQLLEELDVEVEKATKKLDEMTEFDKQKAWNRASRKVHCQEAEKCKLDAEKKKNPDQFKPPKPLSSIYNHKGEYRQCNEGKYEFLLREWEDPDHSWFEMGLPRTVETSDQEVNVYDQVVSVRVLKKLTQIKMFEAVFPDDSKIQRSDLTGQLVITMKKAHPDELLRSLNNAKKQKAEEDFKKNSKDAYEKKKSEEEKLQRIYKRAQESMKIVQMETKDRFGKVVDDSDDEIPDLD